MGWFEEAVSAAERRAIACGAQAPLRSEAVELDDGQFRFAASWISSLSLKDMAAAIAAGGPGAANPFLEPEPALVVCELPPSHRLILNKFPLNAGHALVVTREFREQMRLLEVADFQALEPVLSGADALIMFNGGRTAGASQDHRHIHVMPGQTAPLEPLFLAKAVTDGPRRLPGFRFPHALVGLADDLSGEVLHERFLSAAAACGLGEAADQPAAPYNLLMTRRWMLVAPRTRAGFEADGVVIPIAATAFGGAVMVRESGHLELVRRTGLGVILSACA